MPEQRPHIDALAGALDQLRASLAEHVARAASLVVEAEAAEGLTRCRRSQRERLFTLRMQTRTLSRSLAEHRRLMHELTTALAVLTASTVARRSSSKRERTIRPKDA